MENLTPYNRLKLQTEVYDFQLINPAIRSDEIELESSDDLSWVKKIYDFIKRVVKWCKEKLIQLGKFISEKLGRWFKVVNFKQKANKLNQYIKAGLLNDVDGNELLLNLLYPHLTKIKEEHQYKKTLSQLRASLSKQRLGLESMDLSIFDIKSHLGDDKYKAIQAYEIFGKHHPMTVWWMLLDTNGKVRDINNVVRNTKSVIDYISRVDVGYQDIVYRYFNKVIGKKDEESYTSLREDILWKICLDNQVGEYFDIYQHSFDKNSLNHAMNNFESDYTSTIHSMNKIIHDIEGKLSQVSKEIDRLYKEGISTINQDKYTRLVEYGNKLQLIASIAHFPVYYLVNLSRFLERYFSISMSERFMITSLINHSSLYHLSLDTQLGKGIVPGKRILLEQIPFSGKFEILPPRISFAPTLEGCCYGLVHLFTAAERKGLTSLTFQVYQPVVTNETRQLKPELIKAAIKGDAYLSDEVCIVGEVEIILIGQVTVTWNPKLPTYYPHRYRIGKIAPG